MPSPSVRRRPATEKCRACAFSGAVLRQRKPAFFESSTCGSVTIRPNPPVSLKTAFSGFFSLAEHATPRGHTYPPFMALLIITHPVNTLQPPWPNIVKFFLVKIKVFGRRNLFSYKLQVLSFKLRRPQLYSRFRGRIDYCLFTECLTTLGLKCVDAPSEMWYDTKRQRCTPVSGALRRMNQTNRLTLCERAGD